VRHNLKNLKEEGKNEWKNEIGREGERGRGGGGRKLVRDNHLLSGYYVFSTLKKYYTGHLKQGNPTSLLFIMETGTITWSN
jgi:hypothetical protein